MKLRRIKVENFKSYKKLSLNTNDLNFIIGGNAAGKSNFVNLLKFFNDILNYGIDDAVSLQGGIEYMFNSNAMKKESVVLDYEIDLNNEKRNIFTLISQTNNNKKTYLPKTLNYHLKIKPNENGTGYKISKEKVIIQFEHEIQSKKINSDINQFDFIIIKDSNGKIIDNIDKVNDDSFKNSNLSSLSYFEEAIRNDSLILDNSLLNSSLSVFGFLNRYNSKIKIYNFDVNLLKTPSSIAVRGELLENGSNLVNVIQQLLKVKTKKNKLSKIIKIMLPFVEDIKVENNIDKSVFFKVQESYNKKEFPSNMLSDGTVNILALIVALYFQDDDEIIVLEEPERNIHPKLLSSLVSILNDVSSKKQIFVTTHNPYIIKESNLNDVILISRDEKGVSNILKPIDNEIVKTFLENDLGIEDLFVDGILK